MLDANETVQAKLRFVNTTGVQAKLRDILSDSNGAQLRDNHAEYATVASPNDGVSTNTNN